MLDKNTNILILGRTGVGKSSLLNYLFGSEVAITSRVHPETPRGIHKVPAIKYNGMWLTIYDSWGIEADKVALWEKDIKQILERNMEKNVRDWFHTIIYCISAVDKVSDVERNAIITPLQLSGNRIIFAITKSDLASSDELQSMSCLLKEYYPRYLQVNLCSVTELRYGKQYFQFGKEALLTQISKNFRANIVAKACTKFKNEIDNACVYAQHDVINYFNRKYKQSVINRFKLSDEFKQDIISRIKKDYKDVFDVCYSHFFKSYVEANKLADIVETEYYGAVKSTQLQKISTVINCIDSKEWEDSIMDTTNDHIVNIEKACTDVFWNIKLYARQCIEDVLLLTQL